MNRMKVAKGELLNLCDCENLTQRVYPEIILSYPSLSHASKQQEAILADINECMIKPIAQRLVISTPTVRNIDVVVVGILLLLADILYPLELR